MLYSTVVLGESVIGYDEISVVVRSAVSVKVTGNELISVAVSVETM